MAGKDLRVPVGICKIGVTETYRAMLTQDARYQDRGFNIVDVLTFLDPTFPSVVDVEERDRRLNDMGKFIRTLRANGFVTKVGSRDGFVCCRIANRDAWTKVVVCSIEDEPVQLVAGAGIQAEPEMFLDPAVVQKLALIEPLFKTVADLQQMVVSLADVVKGLEAKLQGIVAPEAELNCPLLKIRQNMHPLLRGSVAPTQAAKKVSDKAHESGK